MQKSGLKALQGNVFPKVREVYARELHLVAKAVKRGSRVRRNLEDIATVAETADKTRFLDSHADWSKTLGRAIVAIKEQLKRTEQAFELLDWDTDDNEFENGALRRAKYRASRASRAWTLTRNVYADLHANIND